MGNISKYNKYAKRITFINDYRKASNASSGSEFDPNANVEHKNIATLSGELPKEDNIGTNRLLMINKLTEMYGEETAEEYIRQLESHEIYKHDETSIMPYTYGAQESVVVNYKSRTLLINFRDLYNFCKEEEVLLDIDKDVNAKYPDEMYITDRNGTTKVERLIKKKRHRDLVCVKTKHGENIIVTDNHPLIISDNKNDTIQAINSIDQKQYRAKFKSPFTPPHTESIPFKFSETNNSFNTYRYNNAVQFTAKDAKLTKEFGYFVGFFIAEGWYSKYTEASEGYDTLLIKQKDQDKLIKCSEYLFNSTGIYSSIYEHKDARGFYILRITNRALVNMLIDEFNISPTTQKNLPKNIFECNNEFKKGIICGLVDGDGASYENGLISLRLSSRSCISQMSYLLSYFNISSAMTYQDTTLTIEEDKLTQSGYPMFGITFALNDSFDLCEKLRDKTQKFKKYQADCWSDISKIDVITNDYFLNDNEYIYDITTQSNTFILNNIWVHNCVSVTLYPFISNGLMEIGGISDAPKNLNSFTGAFINLVFAVSSQFAGAVSTPEFLTYIDYFIRKEYGNDYYLNSDKIVKLGERPETIDQIITDAFQQIVYSINQPAAARNYQSVFWNIAYFDKPYFNGIFDNFVFPDGTEPQWDSVNWLQKRFINWFNEERRRKVLTFPVETMNLLNNGKDYVDQECKDFTAEMYSKGHSFFTYTSDSVDSLASCCFSGQQKTLTKSSSGISFKTFKDLFNSQYNDLKVFHNGAWVSGNLIKTDKRPMYEIITSNNKKIIVTDNHIHSTICGDKTTKDLTDDDWLLFNNNALQATHDNDDVLTYEKGYPYIIFNDVKNNGFDLLCLLQSEEYRRGIIDGCGVWHSMCTGYSDDNCFRTTHKNVIEQMEVIITSLGMYSVVDICDKTNSDYPMFCIKWYDQNNIESIGDLCKTYNNRTYFKIKSIKLIETEDEFSYCFEMPEDEPYFTLPNGIITHNCRLRNEFSDNTFSYTLGAGGVSTGSKGVITININRLVQNAVRNNVDISIAVEEQIAKVHKYLLAFNEIIKDNFNARMLPIYDAGYISLKKQYLTIGINGFVEGAEFLGIDISANEKYFDYGVKVLKPIYDANRAAKTDDVMFNTEYVPKMCGYYAA